jgi:hypothetical protein
VIGTGGFGVKAKTTITNNQI